MLIFAHIPKVGGSWINHILRSNFGVRHCMRVIPQVGQPYFDAADLKFAEKVFPGIDSLSSHYVWDPEHWMPEQTSVFSLLREPVKRTASTYQYLFNINRFKGVANAGTKEHFIQWIADPRNQDFQIRQISGGVDLARAQAVVASHYFFLGLTESMKESVEALAMLSPVPLNIEPPTPKHKEKRGKSMDNRASDNSISKMLLDDPETRQLLEAGNRADAAFYEWVVAEKYPEYLAQAAQAEPRTAPEVPEANYRRSKAFNNGVYAPAQRIRYFVSGVKEEKNPVF